MFQTIFILPLTNALVFLTGLFGGSLGLAVIALTLLVKFILAPLSHRSVISQIEQKKLQPLISDIKKKFPDQKEQSQKLMELYKEHKTNPFAGCLLVLLQLPIIIALYQVFLKGTGVSIEGLYTFIHNPDMVQNIFLGIDLGGKSIIFAIIAGISQFVQMYWSPAMQQSLQNDPVDPKDFQANLANSMSKSMKYTMPIMIVFFAYYVPAAVALYWIISNVFLLIQERYVIYRHKKKTA